MIRISGFTTARPNMPSTRTAEDFFKFLGQKPERLGIISSLYDQYTATYLTEALMNSFAGSNKPAGFTSIPSFVVEWSIKVSKIKRLRMIAAPEGKGECAGDVKFYFDENYYQKYDTFIIERTRQQFIVLNRPQRLRDKCWLIIAKILDDDYDSVVLGEPTAGDTTRWISNNHPELHSEGYTKYTSNTENFRTYIATHRNDVDMSAMYKPLEEVFISIGKGSNANGMDPVYKMNTAEKDCFDNFMEARANASLWSKSNMDASGKPKIYDSDGRPIISSDGIIPQIESFATKFVFSKLNMGYFEKALQAIVSKSKKPQGNQYVMIANTPFYNEWQRCAAQWIIGHKTDGAFLYSMGQNKMVNLGATFESYTFAGNTLIIKVDRCFDIEYPTRKFAIMLDLSKDEDSGKAAINQYTFKGGQFIHNVIKGVGGTTGLASGEVSSPVAGTKIVNFGYSGIGVSNPYKSVILIGEEERFSMWS